MGNYNNLLIKFLYLCVFIFVYNFSFAQVKQIKIVYKYKVINPMPNLVSDSVFYEKLGNLKEGTQLYFYKDGKFKTIIKETGKTELFDPLSMRIYSYNEGYTDTAYFSDALKDRFSLIEIRKTDKKDTVLGFNCSNIKIKTNYGAFYYSYSDSFLFRINTEKFKNYKYDSWYNYLKESNGALPLKISFKGLFLNTEIIALSFDESNINDVIFDLPKFKVIIEKK